MSKRGIKFTIIKNENNQGKKDFIGYTNFIKILTEISNQLYNPAIYNKTNKIQKGDKNA